MTANALLALLRRIGPAILVPHSQPGWAAWRVADLRPNMVKALIQLEPGRRLVGLRAALRPFEVPWGLSYGRMAYSPEVSDPAELEFVEVPVTDDPYVEVVLGPGRAGAAAPPPAEDPYPAPHERVRLQHTLGPVHPRYLEQAGVDHTWIRLTEIGIRGNGHFYFIERNSNAVAGVVREWLAAHVRD